MWTGWLWSHTAGLTICLYFVRYEMIKSVDKSFFNNFWDLGEQWNMSVVCKLMSVSILIYFNNLQLSEAVSVALGRLLACRAAILLICSDKEQRYALILRCHPPSFNFSLTWGGFYRCQFAPLFLCSSVVFLRLQTFCFFVFFFLSCLSSSGIWHLSATPPQHLHLPPPYCSCHSKWWWTGGLEHV